ncbi:MAG TPA: hypothetical protein PLP14_03630 [Chitinophagaceae bacterium]|nr:hypothetical protein [Chitinophagaceae bacterium]
MMRKVMVFLNLFFLTENAQSQISYLPYYSMVNQAEEYFFLKHDIDSAFILYDKAFSLVPKPFVKDCFIAAELALFTGDTSQCLKYLEKTFRAGMPLKAMEQNPMFVKLLQDQNWLQRLTKIKANCQPFRYNQQIRDSVYQRFYDEQVIKRKSDTRAFFNIAHNNCQYFAQWLKKGVFPSEQMIGLYTDEGFADFREHYHLPDYENHSASAAVLKSASPGISFTEIPYDYALWNQAAFISFLHDPCSFQQYKSEWWKAVEQGYIHPKDFALMEEWLAKSVSNPNYQHDCTVPVQEAYYNITYELRVKDEELLKQVEDKRKKAYLQSFKIDQMKREFRQVHKLNLFFGFLDLR